MIAVGTFSLQTADKDFTKVFKWKDNGWRQVGEIDHGLDTVTIGNSKKACCKFVTTESTTKSTTESTMKSATRVYLVDKMLM